jgi:hypothetical protein
MFECDQCKKETLEYFICNKTSKVLCEECAEEDKG